MNRRQIASTMMEQAGSPYGTPVAQPDAAFAFLPFTVYKNGSAFNVGSWDISAQVSRAGGAKYVAKNGNDTTGNGTAGNPYLTIGKAFTILGATADAVVYVGAGRYGWSDGGMANNPTWAVSRSLVATGDVVLDSYLSNSGWSLTSGQTNTYEAGYVAGINNVFDYGTLDSNGDPTKYVKKTSIAEVEATAGTFWYDSSAVKKLYVHTLENNTPDTDVRPQYEGTQALKVTANNINVYMEGVKIYGCYLGVGANGANNTGSVYFKNVRFIYAAPTGNGAVAISGYTAYFQGCQVAHAPTGIDGIYGNVSNTNVAKIVEIDCRGWDIGVSGNTTMNASTNHAAGINVVINGEYYGCYGSNVGYVQAGKAWLLGTNSHDCAIGSGANDTNFQLEEAAWLDSCVSSGSTQDISNGGGTTYLRNFTPASPVVAGGGTVAAY